MALPLQTPTFYRMADQVPAASTIAGLLDAIYAALISTTDYRGTALASTHLWTFTRYQPAGTTFAVYNTAVPSGSPMTLNPAILLAGSSAAPTPTMLSPDTFTASNLLIGIVKNPGSFNAWDNANPMTSGTFSGYMRAAGTTWNSTGATVRVFISQECILIQLFLTATGQSHAWIYCGAILEPHSINVGAAESDERLYGMLSSGAGTTISTAWMNTIATVFSNSVSNGQHHMGVFQPGAAPWFACGRRSIWSSQAADAEVSDSAGVYVGDLARVNRSTAADTHNGARLGLLRGIYMLGALQGGRVLRDGSTDLYHIVSVNNSATDDAFMLKAVA